MKNKLVTFLPTYLGLKNGWLNNRKKKNINKRYFSQSSCIDERTC